MKQIIYLEWSWRNWIRSLLQTQSFNPTIIQAWLMPWLKYPSPLLPSVMSIFTRVGIFVKLNEFLKFNHYLMHHVILMLNVKSSHSVGNVSSSNLVLWIIVCYIGFYLCFTNLSPPTQALQSFPSRVQLHSATFTDTHDPSSPYLNPLQPQHGSKT